MSNLSRIKFSSQHPILRKWSKPSIFGQGKLYDAIKSESLYLDKVNKPHILRYFPPLQTYEHRKNGMSAKIRLCYEKRHLISTEGGGVISVDEVALPGSSHIPDTSLPNLVVFSAGLRGAYDKIPQVKLKWFLDHGYPRVLQCNARGTSRTPLQSPEIDIPHPKYNGCIDVMEYFSKTYPDERFVVVGDCTGSALGINYFMNPISYDHHNVVGGVFDSFQWDGLKFLERQHDYLIYKSFGMFMYTLYLYLGLRAPSTKEVYNEFSNRLGSDRKRFEKFSLKGDRRKIIDAFYHEYMLKLLPDLGTSAKEFHYNNYLGGEGNTNFMKVQKPVVLIAAEDEPFLQPLTYEDVNQIASNPNLCLWLFGGGGHCGFIDGIKPYSSYLKPVQLECIDIIARSSL